MQDNQPNERNASRKLVQSSPDTDEQIDSLAVQLQLNGLQTRWLRTQIKHLLLKERIDELKALTDSDDHLSITGKTLLSQQINDRIKVLEGEK